MPELLDKWLKTTTEPEPTTDLLSGWLATTELEPVEEPTWWGEAWKKAKGFGEWLYPKGWESVVDIPRQYGAAIEKGGMAAGEAMTWLTRLLPGNENRKPYAEQTTAEQAWTVAQAGAIAGAVATAVNMGVNTIKGLRTYLKGTELQKGYKEVPYTKEMVAKGKPPKIRPTPVYKTGALKGKPIPGAKVSILRPGVEVTRIVKPTKPEIPTAALKQLSQKVQAVEMVKKADMVDDFTLAIKQALTAKTAGTQATQTAISNAAQTITNDITAVIPAQFSGEFAVSLVNEAIGKLDLAVNIISTGMEYTEPKYTRPIEEEIVDKELAKPLERVSDYGEKFVAAPTEPPTIPPRVPPSDVPITPGEPEPEIDPIDKLNELLKAAKPLRGAIERAYTEERGKRLTRVEKILRDKIDTVGGIEGYKMVTGVLKGELISPEEKPKFEPVEDKLTEADIKSLYLKSWKHPYLTTFEKVTSTKGLTDLFVGNIPPPSTLVLMEEVYGSELIKNLLSKRLWGAKATDFALEAANIPRALLATADMSAFLRQGIIEIVAHPTISAKAMAKTFEFAFDPLWGGQSFEQYYSKDLREHKHYDLMRKSAVAITDPRKPVGEREEPFISRLLQKIPIVKIPVEFAERAYTGFLTKLRVDIFSLWADELLGQGKSPIKDKKLFDAAADVVNAFTGRGSLGKAGNRIAPQLNAIFFSPRLIAARFNAMNPVWYAKQPPEIRKKALGDFAKFVLAGTTTLALIKLISMDNDDFDVETDPRSADFGKVRVGNTRFDIWGGHQQFVRAFTQIMMGERKSSTTGEIMSLNKDEYPFSTRQDVLYRFIEGKLAPGPALIRELMAGAKTFEGEDITISSVATQKLIPMYIQDIVEAYRDGGLGIAVPAGALAFFGIGVQTYGKPKTKKRQRWK